LNKHLELLIKLQVIDTQIQKSEEIKKKYYEDIACLENELKNEEDTVTKEKEDLQNLEKEHRRLERALEELQGRKEKAQDKLFSIKTNKEYQAALHEIEGIKDSVQKQEDEILTILIKLDSVKGMLYTAEEKLKKINVGYAQKKQQIEAALNQFLQEIEAKKELHMSLARDINQTAMRDYNALLDAKNGLAVVVAHNERCMGCNMKIPPQTYNLVITSDDIIFCPNCRRILYITSETEHQTP
jgi:predicted  nucleic acid-binding Zn-ribbon protein